MNEINFNNPIELVEIFRVPNEPETNPWDERDPMLHTEKKEITYNEYSSKTCVGWERILAIKEYPYEDSWKKFKGPKYWVTIDGSSELMLVYGSYDDMKTYWFKFRNNYPIFSDEKTN